MPTEPGSKRAEASSAADLGDAHSLAASLEPALVHECGGRLSGIEWFRSTWQRGGSATGFARWRGDDGRDADVLVKLPVGPVEHRWTTLLGDAGGAHAPTPRVVAAGKVIGGYDLAWLVLERLDGRTLSAAWDGEALDGLVRAAVQMQRLAAQAEPIADAQLPPPPDWEALVARSREAARAGEVEDAQKWNDTLKRVHKALPRLAARWAARGTKTWCHGDLHPGNTMRRPEGGCVLIDLAFVHRGHWVEDAVYLERQFWSHPEKLFGRHPVSLMARLRREAGLPADDDYGALASVRRVLMAACVPALVEREGSPRYVHAALETLHKLLPQVGA